MRAVTMSWLSFLGLLLQAGAPVLAQTLPQSTMAETPEIKKAVDLFSRVPGARDAAIAHFKKQGDKRTIPILIQAARFSRRTSARIFDALEAIAGENPGRTWHNWMLWQQAHPEIKPPADFIRFKAALYGTIDPNFKRFLRPGVAHTIRIEEITWGGVIKDGIPALTNPKLIAPAKATYITPEELVFGVEINGDARAYPLRILDWHEMFNDVIGGVPVSLAYCTLCGSGILFDTTVKGRTAPFVFGSSGFLYRSNKLMYDQETHSLWNQFTGKPVVGKLVGSGIELRTRPVVITSWKNWLGRHPGTKVLSLRTGHKRDYSLGKAYSAYFSSPDLMFPALVDETKHKAKSYVFALRSSGHAKAWPLDYFKQTPVINDTAGALRLTLVGNVETRTVRAYRTSGQTFAIGGKAGTLSADGQAWNITEAALLGPNGEQLTRLPGHIAYWFAWSGYLGGTGEVAERP
ncbi:MAG: DUF3179 domain-containing protein [Hyphomicrobiaceae bacterium]